MIYVMYTNIICNLFGVCCYNGQNLLLTPGLNFKNFKKKHA